MGNNTQSIRETLAPSVKHHFRITMLGALLVLAPLVLLVHTVVRVRKTVAQVAAPLQQILPGTNLSVGGWSFFELVTLLLVFLACWLFGWIVVRTTLGRSLKNWVEETFLQKTPVYQTYRRVTGQEAAGHSASVVPALVQVAGAWQPGVVVEQLSNGWATVFVPNIPIAKSGQLYCIPGDQIKTLSCSLPELRKKLAVAGRGSQDWLRTIADPKSQ